MDNHCVMCGAYLADTGRMVCEKCEKGEKMTKDEAIKILSMHLMQCGALMPIEWVQKNGDGSKFMQAFEMAMDALKNEPVRCKDCVGCTSFDEYGIAWCWEHDTYIHETDFCSYGKKG